MQLKRSKSDKSKKVSNNSTATTNDANMLKTHYKTRQRDLILSYFKSHKNKHITAESIIDYFKQKDIPVSKSTVYRSLDMLLKDGIISKYIVDEKSSCCYLYSENKCDMHNHYHLRCSDCDKIFHVDDKDFEKISNKIKKEFSFDIDISKTVLYGKCKTCQNRNCKENCNSSKSKNSSNSSKPKRK